MVWQSTPDTWTEMAETIDGCLEVHAYSPYSTYWRWTLRVGEIHIEGAVLPVTRKEATEAGKRWAEAHFAEG